MTGLRLVLLILAIITFAILAILGFFVHGTGANAVTVDDYFGITGLGLALFGGSFLPIP